MQASRIPHTLKLTILLLRLALGLNFFYFGASTLFSAFGKSPVPPLISFSATVSAPFSASLPAAFWPWVSLIIGACLVFGFFTRVASIAGIVLILLSYNPFAGGTPFSLWHLANTGTLVVLCFLILLFSNAGEYFGLDRFIHLRVSKNKEKY